LRVSANLRYERLDGPWRPDPEGHLRAAGRAAAGRHRARERAAGQPAGRLAAPEGAEGCGPRRRPPRGKAPHLSARPERSRRASRRARGLLAPGIGGLQVGRRATKQGGDMSTEVADTSVATSIVVDAPIERAFRVFTEEFGRFKPREHNLLAVEIAE